MTFCIELKSTGAWIEVSRDEFGEPPRDVKTVLYRPDGDYLSSIPDGPQTFFPVAVRGGEYVVAAFGEKTVGTAFYPSDTGLSPRGVRSRVESELRALSVYLFDRIFEADLRDPDGTLRDSVCNCYDGFDLNALNFTKEERKEFEGKFIDVLKALQEHGLG